MRVYILESVRHDMHVGLHSLYLIHSIHTFLPSPLSPPLPYPPPPIPPLQYAASLGDLVPVAVSKQLLVVVGVVRGLGEGGKRKEALESVFKFAVDHFGTWGEEVEKGLREGGKGYEEVATFTCR